MHFVQTSGNKVKVFCKFEKTQEALEVATKLIEMTSG